MEWWTQTPVWAPRPLQRPPGDLGLSGDWSYPGESRASSRSAPPEPPSPLNAQSTSKSALSPPRSRSRRRRRREKLQPRSRSSQSLSLLKVDESLHAGALAAREEIARLLEDGYRGRDILSAIRSKNTRSTMLSSLISGGDEDGPPMFRRTQSSDVETRSAGPPHPSEGEKPGADGPGPVRAGVDPTLNQVMFQFKKKAFPKPPLVEKKEMGSPDSRVPSPTSPADESGTADQRSPSPGRDLPKSLEPIAAEFKKKATPPPPESEQPTKPPRRPTLRVPNRKDPRTSDKYDMYDRVVLELFEEMVILEVKMELVDLVYYDGQIDETRFNQLTDPRSPDTGLRYARLLRRFMTFVSEGKVGGDKTQVISPGSIGGFVEHLISLKCGFKTPQALIYLQSGILLGPFWIRPPTSEREALEEDGR